MRKRKGFTLVELLVVIAILAILASVSVVGYMGFTEKARRSNDEQLVANINHILMADEVFTNSPVAAIDIAENLDEKGFKLETQSKDVDLFYNEQKGRVELGTVDKKGNYSTVYPEEKQSSVKSAQTFEAEGSDVLSSVNSLEGFIDGYILVGQKSQTGISTYISEIRNADSTVEQAELIEKLTEINSKVGSAINQYVGNAAFVGKDNKILEGTVLNGKTYLTFSNDTTELTADVIEAVGHEDSSISFIDIPRKVEISKEAEEKLYDLLSYGNGSSEDLVVVASKEFISSLQNEGLKEKIVSTQDRESATSKVKVIHKDSNGASLEDKGSVEFSNTIRLNGSLYLEATKTANSYYDVKSVELVSDAGARLDVTSKLELISGTYRLPITSEEQAFVNQDKTYTLEITYEEKTGAKASVSGSNINSGFKSVQDALLYTSSLGTSETIRVLENDTIENSVSLGASDTLIVGKNENDDGGFKYDKNGSKGTPFKTLSLNAKLENRGTIIVSASQNYATGGNLSGTISGNYGKIIIKDGGSIVNNDKAVLSAWGEIETKKTESADAIIMAGGSTFNGRATAYFQGGKLSTNSVNNDVFPFADYAIDGVTGGILFENNSRMDLNFGVVIKFIWDNYLESKLTLVSSQDSSLFNLSGGSVHFSIDSNHKATVDIDGKVALNKIEVDLTGFLSGFKINTDKMELPINGNFNININDGAVVDINAKKGIKLLPGAKINVKKGGTINFNNSGLYVYEWNNGYASNPGENPMGFYSGYTYSNRYNNTSYPEDGSFVNDGKVTTTGTNYFSGNFEGSGEYILNGSTDYNSKISEFDYTTKKIVQTYVTKSGTTTIQGKVK